MCPRMHVNTAMQPVLGLAVCLLHIERARVTASVPRDAMPPGKGAT